MFQENEKEWILEAINHLKRRKARPDLSRISLRMKRKHQMSFTQTKKLLESLIECGIVVKAVYKNNTSYRDVSKWKKGKLGGQIMNSNKMLKRFIRAIEANEKVKGTGVSAKDIEDFLASQGEEKCFLSGAALRDALENEISNGYLTKISVGTLVCYTFNSENLKNVSQLLEKMEADEQMSDGESGQNDDSGASGRTSPDIGHLLASVQKAISETEQTEGTGSSLLDIKEFLLINGVQFDDDLFLLELLENGAKSSILTKIVKDTVTLYSINEKTHRLDLVTDSCISNPAALQEQNDGASRVQENTQCSKDRKDDVLLSNPVSSENSISDYKETNAPLRPPSKRRRILKDHGPDFEMEMPTRMKAKYIETKESVYPTPTASPASEKSETTLDQSLKLEAKKKRGRPKKVRSSPDAAEAEHFEDENSKQGVLSEQSSVCNFDEYEDDISLTPSYPDITNWTSQQVAEYFRDKGYVEEAQRMLDNDLDGPALGLLRRSDIVGPPLGGVLKVKKLGIALKLFRDIRDLLYQGNSENYVDPYEERAFLRS